MSSEHKNRPTKVEFKTRCERMYAELTGKISSGEYSHGEYLISEAALGRKYSISRSSSRDIITMLENQGLVTRIKGKGVMVGRLLNKKTENSSVAVIFPTLKSAPATTAFLEAPRFRAGIILEVIENELTRAGMNIKLINVSPEKNEIERVTSILKTEKIAAAVLIWGTYIQPEELIRSIRELGVGLIVAGTVPDKHFSASSVTYNNYQIGKTALQYLYDNGHEKIGLITNSDLQWARERKKAYFDFCREINLKNYEDFIVDLSGGTEDADWIKVGRAGAEKLLSRKELTAIFCINDAIAAGVYDVAMEKGIKIPEGLSVIGCDNNYEYCDLDLSAIKLNCIDLARSAADLAMEYLAGKSKVWPVNINIQPELIRKNSVKNIKENNISVA